MSHHGSIPVVNLESFDKLDREEASKRFSSERIHVLGKPSHIISVAIHSG